MDLGVAATVGLCAFLVLWYGGGHLVNRRLGQRLFHWLEAGLGALGGEVETGWIGSPAAGARVNILKASPPFRRLELTLLLENREILLLWLFDRLRGRRDWLIMKATLRSPGPAEIEIVPTNGRAAQGLRREQERPWTWQEGPHGLAVAYRGPGTQRHRTSLTHWLETYGAHLHRFSWRKTDPHIQLQMQAGKLLAASSEAFLRDLQVVVGS